MYDVEFTPNYSIKYRMIDPKVIHCLRSEIGISWPHFESKYNTFKDEVKQLIDEKLLEMYDISLSIKNNKAPVNKFISCFYNQGDEYTNEFLQSMYDCFKAWQSLQDIELKKVLYEHVNRGTDDWFPLVIIKDPINQCARIEDSLVVYRGCHKSEFDKNTYQQRQSWSTNIQIAEHFAFHYPPSSTPLEQRIVIEASINKKDVLWDRGGAESEVVLQLGFSARKAKVKMTYSDYQNQHEA